MSRSLAPAALVLALALTPAATAVQPAVQIKDIKTTVDPTSPVSPTEFATMGGAIYFAADDGIRGIELWRSDGTAGGTRVVKDICPGVCSSRPTGLTVLGSTLYFSISDFSHGGGLWRSDGTAAGTVPVFPSPSPFDGFFLQPLAVVGTTLLLTGGNFATEEGIYASDGTAAGTALLKGFAISGSPPSFLGQIGGTVVFAANDGPHGEEPWKTDGTAAGTVLVKDINPGSGGSLSFSNSLPVPSLPVVGGRLFFAASDSAHGQELWSTDGTTAGTVLVKDVVPGAESSSPGLLTALGSIVCFTVCDPSGCALWKSDGTEAGTAAVQGGFGVVSELTAAGSRLFFRALTNSTGLELWTSDGTTAGTSLVKDIYPSTPSGLDPSGAGFFPLGNRLIFFANDGTHGAEPWVSDGTAAGTVLLADLNPGAGGSGTGPHLSGTALAGVGLFPAYGPTGWGLYATDGTPGGTARLQDLNTQASALVTPSYLPLFVDRGGTPLFRADDGTSGSELWTSDGTAAGTALVKDLVPGPDASQIDGLTAAGTQAFFTTTSFPSGTGLWTSDGTTAGTQSVVPPASSQDFADTPPATAFADKVLYLQPNGQTLDLWRISPNGASASLSETLGFGPGFGFFASARVGDFLYFILPNGSPLYRTDGTPAAAVQVAPGPFYNESIGCMVSAGPLLFFASSGQLYVSDGTAAGTRSLTPAMSFFFVSPLVVAGGRVFFLADDLASSAIKLWVSDGTIPGTHPAKDIQPGPGFSSSLAAVRERVFFTADDGIHGMELWVSDGTDAGTHLVQDILPGSDSSQPQNLVGIGHLLFFAATDGVHDLEPWTSDGTAAGTHMLQDIAPGDLPSSPWGFTASGPYVYFAANDGTHGFEPWALPRAGLGGFLQATLTVAGHTWEGGTVTYTLTVTNVGAGPHPDNPGDEVSDTLPAGLTLLSANADSGAVTVDLPGNRVAWNGALDPGASVTITIQAQVADGTFGTPLANQATLSFDADGDGANESTGVSDDPGKPGAADATVFAPATSPLSFYTVTPCRIVDTRSGAPLASGAVRTLAIAGSCGVPAGARAIAANLTIVGPTGPGFLTLYPAGRAAPLASTINFSAGQTRANNAGLPLSGGQLDVFAFLLDNGHVDLLLDVVGYYQ